MSRAPVRMAGLAAALLLAACASEDERTDPDPAANPAGDTAAESGDTGTAALPPPGGEPTAAEVPHSYLALQPAGAGHPTSVVFAIDASRDGTPSDDRALRLTPDDGDCNPQEMQRYDFPADAAPAVGDGEQARGLTPRELPDFLAASVTGRLIDTGLASEPEDTRALNICTRKLWERLVLARNSGRVTAGQ